MHLQQTFRRALTTVLEIAALAAPLALPAACSRSVPGAAAVQIPPGPLAAPEGARRLCSQHVSGTGMHIAWQSWALSTAPEDVAAAYARRYGARAQRASPTNVEVRDDEGGVLTVFPAAEAQQHPRCEQGPLPDERTIVMLSRVAR